MKMKIEFEMDNAAFEDGERERDFIFNRLQERLAEGAVEGKILDSNGNTVGKWSIK